MQPTITVEASPRGVDRVIIAVDEGDRAGGFTLLERAMPAIRELDRRTRPPLREEPGT